MLNEATNAIIGLVAVGVTVRIIYLILQIIINPDDKQSYIEQIKTMIIVDILAISTFGIKEIAQSYFGGWDFVFIWKGS